MARAARVYNVKGTGAARSDSTPSSFSRTAALRGNASSFKLYRAARGGAGANRPPPGLPTPAGKRVAVFAADDGCEWQARDTY